MSKIFGERLKELRKAKKLSQKEIGELLGMSDVSVGHWEKGNREPSLDTIIILADFFKVTTDYLLGRVNNKNEHYVQANFLDTEGLEHKIEMKSISKLTIEEIQFLIKELVRNGIDIDKMKI